MGAPSCAESARTAATGPTIDVPTSGTPPTSFHLGYWKIRGLAANLRYQLAYSTVPYDDIVYEQGDASTAFCKKCWFDVKWDLGMEFPNLPYLKAAEVEGEGAGSFMVSETQAIHQYLAAKCRPSLLGDTAEETARINELFGVLEAVKNTCTGVCYREGATKETVLAGCTPGFQRLANYLETTNRPFLVMRSGSDTQEPKWVDFYFLELLERFNWLLDDKLGDKYPVLQTYRCRMAELPGVREQLEKELPLTFNNRHAPLNGHAFALKMS
eukprot:g16768.t1